jgi:hypothetical protein
VLVSLPARDPAVARDRLRYTNMYETRNETADLARTLVVAALGRPLGQRTGGQSVLGSGASCP